MSAQIQHQEMGLPIPQIQATLLEVLFISIVMKGLRWMDGTSVSVDLISHGIIQFQYVAGIKMFSTDFLVLVQKF